MGNEDVCLYAGVEGGGTHSTTMIYRTQHNTLIFAYIIFIIRYTA
jgi:hypothetical protein